MASTPGTIVDQIRRRLASGNPSVASKVHPLEIKQSVMQVLNSLLRPQFFQSMQIGENEVMGGAIVFYDNVPVTAYNGVSKCTLPAMPLSLPRNMGVHRISKANDVMSGGFIPLLSTEAENMGSQRLLSTLLPTCGYRVRGKEIIFDRDLTAGSPATNAVSIELVVADFSQCGDYDLLPISADMEFEVIETVVKMFAGSLVQPQNTESTSDTKQ